MSASLQNFAFFALKIIIVISATSAHLRYVNPDINTTSCLCYRNTIHVAHTFARTRAERVFACHTSTTSWDGVHQTMRVHRFRRAALTGYSKTSKMYTKTPLLHAATSSATTSLLSRMSKQPFLIPLSLDCAKYPWSWRNAPADNIGWRCGVCFLCGRAQQRQARSCTSIFSGTMWEFVS